MLKPQSRFRALIEGRVENPHPEELARARAVLEQMLEADPGEARLYYYIAVILERQEEWDEAAKFYNKAVGLDPQCSEYHANMGAGKSRRSPIQHYRSRLARIYSRIGEDVVRLGGEICHADSEETLKEKIDLARKLKERIESLSAAEKPITLEITQDEDEVTTPETPAEAPTPPPIEPVTERSFPEIQEKSEVSISGKRKALLNIKNELESIYELISNRPKQVLPATAEDVSAESTGDIIAPDRAHYRKELESLDTYERLQLHQLFKDLESNVAQTRSLAVDRLEEKGLGAANPILLKRWQEESVPEIQFKIISILTGQGYAPLVPAARQVMETNRTDLALSAMEALYRLDSHASLSYFQQALRNKVPAIKKRAITYIGWIKDYSSIPELVRLLRDPDAYIRKTVTSALASFKAKRSVHFLIQVLMDPVPGVRSYAYKTLKKLIGQTFDYDSEANFIRRKETVERLSLWWEAVEGDFSLAPGSPKTFDTHLFSMKLTTDPGGDAVTDEEILSAVSMSEDGANLLEISQRIGIPWQKLIHKVEQLRQEGKLEKTERKFALARNME